MGWGLVLAIRGRGPVLQAPATRLKHSLGRAPETKLCCLNSKSTLNPPSRLRLAMPVVLYDELRLPSLDA